MSQDAAQDKQTIRKEILKQRRQFPHQEWQKASQKIWEYLLDWPTFQEAETIHLFINQPHEVETRSIVRYCWQSQKTVVIPYRLPHSSILGHSILSHFDQLVQTQFDLQEPLPEARQAIPLEMIDLVLVPGVAFDQTGGRLGYGKGYYDRFLSQVEAFFLGLTFSFQVLPSFPQSPFDISMDAILTEDGFIFKSED